MTNAQATDTSETNQVAEAKEKGPSPFLRGVSKGPNGFATTVCLWAHAEGAKTHMHGFVLTGGKQEQVTGFFNDKDGKKSIALSAFKDGADGAEGKWEKLGYGNAVNSNKNGDPVYFDTVVFNIGGETIGARVTKATDQGLRDKIGFTSALIARPAKEAAAEAETTTAADRPRG